MNVQIDISNLAINGVQTLNGIITRISDNEDKYIAGCRMPDDNSAIRNYIEKIILDKIMPLP